MDLVKPNWKFCTVECQNGTLLFSNGESIEATEEQKRYFALRKKLMATKDKDGNWIIIRWNDLHRHTGYSVLDSAILVSDMVSHTEFAGAITDHGNMRGTLEYYKAMIEAGKFPIVGEEFYAESMEGKLDDNHLILLAKNDQGYKNLCKLSTLAWKHFHSYPHVTHKLLEKYHEGVICLSACLGGEVAKKLAQREVKKAEEVISWYKNLFGDDYYLEIQRHGIAAEDIVNPLLVKMSKKHNIKLVATTDSHYVNKDDGLAHLALLCIRTQSTVDNPKIKYEGTGYHLQTADDMETKFHDIPEALDNTLEILDKCKDFEIDPHAETPKFIVPAPYASEEKYFEHLCWTGMTRRFGEHSPDGYDDRLTFEIDTIKKMEYCGYFLIVQDFINYAKDNNIAVGPGRGSAAGSLAAYALGITEVDPIKYNLLFERFLNPDRVSMPDVDTDFSTKDRDKVIEYVRKKYGVECVSKIIDITTLKPRGLVRDLARVLGFPYALGDAMSKAIPNNPKITVAEAYKQSPELQQIIQTDPNAQKIWDIAKRLENVPRGVSIHACGILIAPSEVSDFMPQEIATDRETGEKAWVTQYVGPQCEEMGLLKMDFLALRTLDVIYSTIDKVNRDYNVGLTFEKIPINDPRAFKLIQQGFTDGIFQMESPGMTQLIKDMFYDVRVTDSPEKGDEYLERLIAAVALYRPGPMDEIPNYIKSMKTGNIVYDTPGLEPVLKNTYGILVYQEQAMMAVRVLAGFSKGQSDIIRKGMAKKKEKLLNEYGEYFVRGSEEHDRKDPKHALNIPGCIKKGLSEQVATTIWEKMKKFGAYAFNKSHACAYAIIAAKTAWLACHYPVEFMASTLDSWIGKDVKKLHATVKRCKEKHINLLQPDINCSHPWFEIEPEKGKRKKNIRYALNAINGIGGVMANSIEDEKNKRGAFASLDDFIERMARYQKISKASVETLVYAGALDCFKGTRAAKIKALSKISDRLDQVHKTNFDQVSLFEMMDQRRFDPIVIEDIPEFSLGHLADYEEETLGFIQNYPTIQYRPIIAKKNAYLIADLFKDLGNEHVFIGIVKNVVQIQFGTEKAGLLKFTMEDESGSINCVAYQNSLVKNYKNLKEGEVCYVKGRVSDNPKYGIQAVLSNSYLMSNYQKRVEIARAI